VVYDFSGDFYTVSPGLTGKAGVAMRIAQPFKAGKRVNPP
jgi:hypothetical protein